jgi:hypothetical protein
LDSESEDEEVAVKPETKSKVLISELPSMGQATGPSREDLCSALGNYDGPTMTDIHGSSAYDAGQSKTLLDSSAQIASSKISHPGVIDIGREEDLDDKSDLTVEEKIWKLAENVGSTAGVKDELEELD